MRVLNAWWTPGLPTITVVEQTDTGIRLRHEKARHDSFLRASDITPELLGQLRSSPNVLSVVQEGKWYRIGWRTKDIRRAVCDAREGWFASKEIQTFEGDVHPVRRFLTDNDVQIAKPRRAYFDIETCGRFPFTQKEMHRVLSWSLVDDAGHEFCFMADADTDEEERLLLQEFWNVAKDYDQLLAWNGDRFDFPVIWARSQRQRIRVDARRWLWLDQLELFRRMNMSASESGDEKQNMSLESVAQAVLGRGKHQSWKRFGKTMFDVWSHSEQSRDEMLEYNLEDSRLMRDIERKTGYVDLLQAVAEACRVFPDSRSINPQVQVDGFLLTLGQKHNEHFATRDFTYGNSHDADDDDEAPGAYKGAYVMDPTVRGIAHKVHVIDFASMYPSIITSFNMSPETVVEKPERPRFPQYLLHLERQWKPPPREPDVAEAPLTTVWFRQAPKGILPRAVDELGELRAKWSKLEATLVPNSPEWQEAHRRSTAYKIARNAFYGVVGSQTSRYYDVRVAESVSQVGVWLLKSTASEARSWGIDVVYGDTDSNFMTGCDDERVRAFVEHCNKVLYPRLLAEQGATRNTVEVAYDKKFERIVFLSAKRYVARIEHSKGKRPSEKTKPEIKGIEYKRGDSVSLARRMQAEIIDSLMGGGILGPRREECIEDASWFVALVERWRERVLNEPVQLEDVVMSKRLAKELKEYAVRKKKDGSNMQELPHLRIARLLKERGRDIGYGTRVEYVILDGSKKPKEYIPAEDWTGECDRYELWENLVYPPSRRLLESAFPAHDWVRFEAVRPRRVASREQATLSFDDKPSRKRVNVAEEQLTLLDMVRR